MTYCIYLLNYKNGIFIGNSDKLKNMLQRDKARDISNDRIFFSGVEGYLFYYYVINPNSLWLRMSNFLNSFFNSLYCAE